MTADREAGTVTWGELLVEAEAKLAGSGLDLASNEVRWIVEEAAGDRFEKITDELATQRGVVHLDSMLGRRRSGEPIQYVLGHWSFRTLDLMVDERALIPRPETEVVAGVAIEAVAQVGRGARVVDLGTGSGAIALAIAAECEGVEVWATDRSPAALEVARANCAGLGRRASAVTLLEGRWFDALPPDLRGRLDVIVSNPPYVATGDELPAVVEDWEPPDALRSGPDGLDDLRHLVAHAIEWLVPIGTLVCEIDPRQAVAVADLARAAGFVDVDVRNDLAGRPRALVACRG